MRMDKRMEEIEEHMKKSEELRQDTQRLKERMNKLSIQPTGRTGEEKQYENLTEEIGEKTEKNKVKKLDHGQNT